MSKETFAVTDTDFPGIKALVLLSGDGKSATQLACIPKEYADRVKAAIGQRE